MTFDEIMDAYDAAVSKANAANETRFQKALEVLTGAQATSGDLYNQALALTEGMGTTRGQEIESSAAQAGGKAVQSAQSRGLGNSTVVDSLLRGITSDKTKAQTQLGEAVNTSKANLLTQKAGAGTNLAALIANLYESKSDNAPNAALYSQLAQQAAQGQAKPIRITSSAPMTGFGSQLEKRNYGF